MPGFDRTGPMGEGPMTGGARGRCNPRGSLNSFGGLGMVRGARRGFGQGFGSARGYGRGPGRRGFSPAAGGWYGPAYDRPYAMNEKDQITMLKNEAYALNSELAEINKRIRELESNDQDQ